MTLDGLNVVVTGAISGESRQTAEAKLRDRGATVQSAVTGKTDLLVTGERVGKSKLTKAEANGVRIVTWAAAMNGTGAATAAPHPVARAAARTVAPMLAKKTDELPKHGYSFEIKWDGYRCVATVKDGAVKLQSRSAKTDYTEQFAHVAELLAQLPDCVIDGELVDLSEAGGSFETIHSAGGTASFLVFDLLEIPGHDLRRRPIEERRQLLEALLVPLDGSSVAASPVFDDDAALVAFCRERKLEGIVAKRHGSAYIEGSKTDAWLKFKLRCEQEFVVIGWKPGEGERAGMIGSLLLAVNNDAGVLEFVGRCGTGGTDEWWRQLQERLGRYSTGRKPDHYDTNGAPLAELRDVTWVVPDVVVQVAFQRWTTDGRLWHPSVLGIRDDKDAGDVRREQ